MSYPSVTQILSVYQDFSMVPENVLHMACERGQRVHAICAAIAKGLFVPTNVVTPDIAGYVASFQKWFEYVEKVHLVEEELTHTGFGYMGHPDLVVTIKGDSEPSLWDLKTPAIVGPTWKAQLAAYDKLIHEDTNLKPNRCGSIRLKPNGKPPILDEYTGYKEDAFTAFLSALNAYRYFKGE